MLKADALSLPFAGLTVVLATFQAYGIAVGLQSSGNVVTEPGPFSKLVAAAVEAETGIAPELSTTGGTSDARFLRAVCPVIEFGLCNATMHKRDEAVAIPDLAVLARIYARIARAALALGEELKE